MSGKATEDKLVQWVQKTLNKYAKPESVPMVILAGVLLTLLFSDVFAPVVSYTMGYLYPAGMSVKAIRNENSAQRQRDAGKWLIYWVVLSCFKCGETLFGFIFRLIPMFKLVKMLFILYLTLPQFRGATLIFETLLQPFVDKHWSTISIPDFAKSSRTESAKAAD